MLKRISNMAVIAFIAIVIGSSSLSYLNCGGVFDYIQNSKYPPDRDFHLGFVLRVQGTCYLSRGSYGPGNPNSI
jgi:hypothetical protein